LVVVHGDTSSSFAAAVCSFYAGIPVVHVEAGLRTGDNQQPFPEEFNRRAIAAVAAIHFAPTELAHDNLLREGAKPEHTHVVGNTIVDAVGIVNRVLTGENPSDQGEREPVRAGSGFSPLADDYLLVTVHRRENFGKPLERIICALKKIAADFPGLKVVVLVHPNPMVAIPLRKELAAVHNVVLMKPLSYLDFARLIKFSKLVITDSGGVQEECVSFGTPLLILREKSERPEGIALGLAELVGTDDEVIVARASDLLSRQSHTVPAQNPYGDGLASVRIAEIIGGYLEER
jgi:UDP-N-acetylglucosamine 2-epimerase (non-hydrolysing)